MLDYVPFNISTIIYFNISKKKYMYVCYFNHVDSLCFFPTPNLTATTILFFCNVSLVLLAKIKTNK